MSDSASKAKGLLWLVIACTIGVMLAFGVSPLVHMIPWGLEKKIAYVLGADYEAQECRSSPATKALLTQLVKRIYPVYQEDKDFSVEVRIVKNNVVNAYAQLGGEITFNSALLKQAESPEEIAGVLAHEIEHVHHRHILEGVVTHMLTYGGINTIFSDENSSAAEWTNYFLNMNFTRSQESQADEEGLRRLQKAHVDNRGFKHFFERMEKSESASVFMSDHPSSDSRLAMVEKFENHDTVPIMTQNEWEMLKNYCN